MGRNRDWVAVGIAVVGWALIVLGIVALTRQKPTYVVQRVYDTVYVKMPAETMYVQAKLPRTGGRVKVPARGGRSIRDSATVEVRPVGDSLLLDVTLQLAERDTMLPVALNVPVQAESGCSGWLYSFALGMGMAGLLLAVVVLL